MSRPTRWATDTADGHSEWYAEHFRAKRDEGADLEGEARLLDAMLPRHARVLDGGCGQGRTGTALHHRGHTVVGVDADAVLIEAARIDNPGPEWIVADLTELDLPAYGIADPFDAAVLAGNVMSFVAPGTEADALRRVFSHLTADGFLVTVFHLEMCDLETFDAAVAAAGLSVRQRFATWDLKPWPGNAQAHSNESIDFCVSVIERRTQD